MPQPHLSDEQLLRLATGLDDRPERQSIQAHVADCLDCRRKLQAMGTAITELRADLEALTPETPEVTVPDWPQRLHSWLSGPRLAVAVGILVVVVSSPFVISRLLFGNTGKEIVRLHDSAGDFKLRDTHRLEAPIRLPDNLKARIASALAGEGIPELASLAPLLEDLRAKSALLAVVPPSDKLVALSPINCAVATNRPTFRWSALAGATAYDLTVRNDAGFRWQTNAVSGTNFTIPLTAPALPAGQAFIWQVETRVNGALAIAHPGGFVVLDTATTSELRRLEKQFGNSPLTLATLYTAHGMLDEAQGQFERVRALNTNHPVTTLLLDQLARRRGRGQ